MTAPPHASVRRLEPRDLADAAAIANAAIARGESTLGPDALEIDALRAELLDAPSRFESYVCEADGGLSGWATLMRHTHRGIYDTVAELHAFVATDCRQRGLGRLLVEHALARAPDLGFRVLLAILQPDPPFQLAWAFRLGFRHAGGLSGVLNIGDESRDIVVMQRWMRGAP